jgi:hypothetical protein
MISQEKRLFTIGDQNPASGFEKDHSGLLHVMGKGQDRAGRPAACCARLTGAQVRDAPRPDKS